SRQRVAQKREGRQRASHFDDEHHGIPRHRTRIELANSAANRAADDRRVPDGDRPGRHQKTCPCCMSRCSTIGPRLSAGKNVSAPTMTITLTSSALNRGVVTGKVPGDGGIGFFRPRLPASASIGTIIRKRPASVAIPIVTLYQRVFALRPPNADPLFPVPDVN